MATYIAGMTDYIPQVQPFQPDLNFYGNVLQTKQTKYDTAHKQLSGIYGSLLNAPLTRTDNIQKREEMFKMIDSDIKKVSGLDLSLQQNVDIAKNVFEPILQDESIFKDMTWTKNFGEQMQRAEGFRLCTDPEKCGGSFWEAGVAELQYKRQEFMNAAPEDAMNFKNVKFTPAFNVMEDAMKKIKDSGFEVKFDEVKNGYIVTTKNGEQILGALQDYLAANYGSDQRVLDYYHTQAYVSRKSWVEQNKDRYDGNEDAANSAYAQEWLAKSAMKIKQEKDNAIRNHNDSITTKTALEEVASSGVAPDEDYFTKLWNNTLENVNVAQASLDVANTADATVKATGLNIGNKKVFDESFDRQMANNMMYTELGNVAYAYQQLTQGRELKADPFALEGQRHANQLERIHLQKGYYDPNRDKYTPGLDAKNAEYKAMVEQQIKDNQVNQMLDLDSRFSGLSGSANFNTANGVVNQLRSARAALGPDDVQGASTVDTNEALRTNVEGVHSQTMQMHQAQRKLGHDYFYELRKRYNDKDTSREGQKLLLNALVKKTGIKNFNVDAFLNGDGKELAKLDKYGGAVWDKVSDVIMNDFNPDNQSVYGLVSSNVMGDYWELKTPEYTEVLKAKRDFKTITDDVRTQGLHTIDKIRGSIGKEDEMDLPGLDIMYDEETRNLRPELAQLNYEQKSLKMDLLEHLVSNSKSGLFPQGEELKVLTKDWASQQKDVPGRVFNNYKYVKKGHIPSADDGIPVTNGILMKERAPEEFAIDNLKGLRDVFYTAYKQADSWKDNPELGNYLSSTGETSAAVKMNYDLQYGDNLADNVAVTSVLNNWNNTSRRVAQYENLSELAKPNSETVQAQQTLQAYINYMNQPTIKKDQVRPAGTFRYQNIAFNDRNFTGGTITPSSDFLEEYARQSGYTKAEDKKAFIAARQKPINFAIPTNEASNPLYQGSQVSINDYRLANDKPIVVDYYKGAGKAQITSAGKNGYNVVFDLKYYTDEGQKRVSDNVFIPRSVTLDGDALERRISDDLAQLEIMNYIAKVNARRNGIKGDPQKVNQMLNQFTQDYNGQRTEQ